MQRRLRSYFSIHFRHDLQAALTVALIAIPQSMAYALIAGINPIYGLAGVIIPAILAPIFGNSPYLVTGFSNAIAITTAGVLQVILALPIIWKWSLRWQLSVGLSSCYLAYLSWDGSHVLSPILC
jgi:SulP family sulfate permease